MKTICIIIGWTYFITCSFGQAYTSGSIFAHNDYIQPVPFYNAYSLKVGYIEADVFLQDDELFVAHQHNEIMKDRKLSEIYLKPLQKEIMNNAGWAYPDSTLRLRLMVDLKTEGVSTLKKLVEQLRMFPELISAKGFEVFISGNVPSPDRWIEFPSFIHFDGRPGIRYKLDQLKRITLVSTNFRIYSKWNGEGEIPEEEVKKLDSLIHSVHAMSQKIRFWSIPDAENVWYTLMKLNVDVIGTDRVTELSQIITNKVK